MFEKINRILISRYPLLWNTKIVFVLPGVLILHLLFYIGGYLTQRDFGPLWFQHLVRMDGSLVTFSILMSLLVIIFWLVHYLRNNPFKSFYSLGTAYLFSEFLIILIIFFTSSAFFLSYKQGLYDKVKSRSTDLTSEADRVNLAMHFVVLNPGDFDIRNSCDSLRARRQLMQNKYGPADDAGNNSYYRYEYEYSDPQDEDALYAKSYLYYCQRFVNVENMERPLQTPEQLNLVAVRWLAGNKKDSIVSVIRDLNALSFKYGRLSNLDPDSIAGECFYNNKFNVRPGVSRRDNYRNISDLKTSLIRIDEYREGFWTYETVLIMACYALGAAFLLFSFRITRKRPWFIALLGVVLWSIILGLIGTLIRHENNILKIIFSLWFIFLAAALALIWSKEKKFASGVIFNWLIWLSPFMIPLYVSIYVKGMDDDTWNSILTVNIGLMIVLIMVMFIPLARKWQSNPEE